MDSDTPSKATLLGQWPYVIIEQCSVVISPDGSTEVHIHPADPRIEAKLNYEHDSNRPQVEIATTCPAIVYFSGTVYNVRGALTFFRKDVIAGWSQLIVGLDA